MIRWLRRRPAWHILAKLHEIERRQIQIMADLTKLNAAVAANTQAVADVQAVVAGLTSGSDQDAIDAAATQIEANTTALEALKPTAPSS